MMKHNGIWVLMDTTSAEDIRTGLELLTPGRYLADRTGLPLTVLILGHNTGELPRKVLSLGADTVLLLEDPGFGRYDTDTFYHAIVPLVLNHEPEVLLVPATEHGRDLAPRLACRFRTGLTADCTHIDMDADGRTVAWTRPAMGGNLMATIVCRNSRPQMGTVRPGVFPLPAENPSRGGEMIPVQAAPEAAPSRVRLLEEVMNVLSQKEDSDSRIIVSGGLGMGSPENFRWIHRLAAVLGGSVGASRGAVQEGWAPYSCQIGQSGRTVRPKLYIACGISGAIQHLAGIASAECVIAINSDPEAPIFQAANYGIVGDAVQILPELIALLEKNGFPGKEA